LAEADAAATAAVRAQLQQHPGEILVTYVGSFAVYQGIDLLFGSMPHAVAGNSSIRFIIIGGGSEEIELRQAQLKDHGIDSRVSMIGKVPPDVLPDYLAASDILLSPRIAGHNTPLKLLDYLKAARPVVATDNEANRLILSEDLAVLVSPAPRDLADGILRLAGDRELRERLGAKGRLLIDEEYNFENFRSRLADCYDSVRRKRRKS
jgi:glycosyltransferase involved in cell wall biosynthesis